MSFSKEMYIQAACEVAKIPQPTKALRKLLEETLADPGSVIGAISLGDEEEIMLYEDDSLSLWFCRFNPDVVMPPHEHKMTVHIGVLSGGEKNIMYRRENNELKHIKTKVVHSGEILTLGPDGIHAVTADGDKPSYALHIYEEPLMQVKRSLFDWDSGEKVEFTMENFYAMTRPSDGFAA